MKFAQGIVPIFTGIDKFTDFPMWKNYFDPALARCCHSSPHPFMMIVGVIEIVVRILVLARRRAQLAKLVA